uniref:Ovule protein n=1 Tax=Ascaris lumbricoides TaxID=6252 RepID=A0A0M3HV37_ASCLU
MQLRLLNICIMGFTGDFYIKRVAKYTPRFNFSKIILIAASHESSGKQRERSEKSYKRTVLFNSSAPDGFPLAPSKIPGDPPAAAKDSENSTLLAD